MGYQYLWYDAAYAEPFTLIGYDRVVFVAVCVLSFTSSNLEACCWINK